jgi:DNA-binding response OmpR family regulator
MEKMSISILLLEDDPILSKEISTYLTSKSIVCETVFDGDIFQRKFRTHQFDLFILDINVPKINGIEICKLIRDTNKTIPILMLTAFEALEDKIDAFEAGADDYLVKPFHFEELLARIKVLLRRSEVPQHQEQVYSVDDLIVNTDKKEVKRNGGTIDLTPKEYKLLCILMEAKGNVLSKQEIAERLWDYHIETSINTIEVYINFLRKKIDALHENKLIHTKVGFGYFIQ